MKRETNILLVSIFTLFSNWASASWFEFCYLSGEVVSDIQKIEDNILFDFRIDSIEMYKFEKNGRVYPNYTNCTNHLGRTRRVKLKDFEDSEIKLYKGSIECFDYTHVERVNQEPITWKLGCENS